MAQLLSQSWNPVSTSNSTSSRSSRNDKSQMFFVFFSHPAERRKNLQGSHQVLLDSYCDEQNTLKSPKSQKKESGKVLCQSAQDLGSPCKSLNQISKNQMISDVTALRYVSQRCFQIFTHATSGKELYDGGYLVRLILGSLLGWSKITIELFFCPI